MKLAIVSEYYYPLIGGISEHVHFFAKECARLGHQVTIITSNAKGKLDTPHPSALPRLRQGYGGQAQGERGKNIIPSPFFQPKADPPLAEMRESEGEGDIELIRLGRCIPFYSNGSFARVTIGFGLKRKMKEILNAGKFDIVHIHSPSIPVLPAMAQLVSKGPTVGTFHTYFEASLLYAISRNLAQDAIENLDGRIAVSKLCVDSLTKYFDADFKIIPNGVDVEYFSTPQGRLNKFRDGKINILFLARLDPRNGLECLIKAFRIIHKKYKDVRLIVVGDGPIKFYFKTLVDKAIADDIHFEGLANGLRPDYYNVSDIFCFPVQKASFGITILEAMAAGKPIICSDLPAFHDILGGSDACRFIDPYDEEDVALKLSELIEDATLRKNLGETARSRVERYSWKNVTQEVLGYYNEILSGKKVLSF